MSSYAKSSLYFILLLLGGALLVLYFVVKPFLGPFILAAVLAFSFQPIYQKLLRVLRENQSLAALLTAVIAIFLVILPLAFLGAQILKESSHIYNNLASGDSRDNFVAMLEQGVDRVRTFLSIPGNFKTDFNQYLQQGLNALVKNLGAIFSSFAQAILDTFVFLISFYFLLKDGAKLKNYFIVLSPLSKENNDMIVRHVEAAVSSVVKGDLLIGLFQGILTGIGLTLFGVPNAVLWGSVAAVAALIPGIGTALVITPAIIFLYITGNIIGATGLLIWGAIAVGLIDNFLGPKLIGRGMQLHPLAVFLAVLGGLAFFGPLGLLLGPLTMSLCLVLIKIYFSLMVREEKMTLIKK